MVKNYLLETPKGIIAIGTGYPGGADKFKSRFEYLWPLSELKYIFRNHHHDDYAGFLGDLLKMTDAKVILHPMAVQTLEKEKSNESPGAGYSSFAGYPSEFCFCPDIRSIQSGFSAGN